jgi:hypothetical protein
MASVIPIDQRNVSTYTNQAPRFVLSGEFICGDCLCERKTEWALYLTFNGKYALHTPDVMEWCLLRLYYPEETTVSHLFSFGFCFALACLFSYLVFFLCIDNVCLIVCFSFVLLYTNK